MAFAKEGASGQEAPVRTLAIAMTSWERRPPMLRSTIAGRALAAKVRRGAFAPVKAVEAIQAAVALPFDEGCRQERELFATCVASDQARALIHEFFAERGVAKVPGITKETPVRPVGRVAIIGAGTMERRNCDGLRECRP